MKHTPLVVGNWKMNPATLKEAKELFVAVRKGMGTKPLLAEVMVVPPLPFLPELAKLSPSGRIALGAQNISRFETGAHTGEVGLSMVISAGANVVLIGHSERRAHGETDEDVRQKVQQVIAKKHTAIVCVGEKERDAGGAYFTVVENQVRAALNGVKPAQLKHVVIAYEPIWAIGTGKTATATDAGEMKLFIQKTIVELYGRNAMHKVRVLYGGSVKEGNAQELLVEGQIDGFLIGGASLKAKEFTTIIKHAHTYAQNAA